MTCPFRCSDAAVADVVGTILLTAVSVIAMAGFAVVVFALDRPEPALRAEFAFDLRWTDDAAASSYDAVRITHLGGDPIPFDRTRIVVQADGRPHVLERDGLGAPFDDGRMTIGETWTWQGRLVSGQGVGVDIVDVEARRIIGSHAVAPTEGAT